MQFFHLLLTALLASVALARAVTSASESHTKSASSKLHHATTSSRAHHATTSAKGHHATTSASKTAHHEPPTSTGGSVSSSGSISGLDAAQSKNAQAIMGEAKKEGLPLQACLAGIATALQESTLYVYANPTVPQSMKLPHQKVGSNLDSVGLFQQRPTYYPNVAADMNPAQSAAQFFKAMQAISGWQTMDVSDLCQAVQKAAAGNLYGKRVPEARTICKAGGFS